MSSEILDVARRLAVEAGYALGFAGPSTGSEGDLMLLPRQTVYPWDWGRVPLVIQNGFWGRASRAVARFTNRCSVGTAFFQKMLRRRY